MVGQVGFLSHEQIAGPGERTRRFGRCPRVSALPARAGIKTLAAVPVGLARSDKISGTGDTPKTTSGKGQGGHWLIVNLAINHTCVVRLNDISINTTRSMSTLLTFTHLTSNLYH